MRERHRIRETEKDRERERHTHREMERQKQIQTEKDRYGRLTSKTVATPLPSSGPVWLVGDELYNLFRQTNELCRAKRVNTQT